MSNFLTRMKDRALASIGVQPALTEKVGGGGGGGKHQVVSAIKLTEAGIAAVNAVPSDPLTRYAFLAANMRNTGLAPGLVGITVDQLNFYEQALAPQQIRWDNKKNALVDRNGTPISVGAAATLSGIPTPK